VAAEAIDMMSRTLAVIGCLLIAGAAMAQTGSVEVKDAWARAVSSPEAKKAGLHTMTMEGSVMKMRPLAGVDVPANQPVALKPGGTHIMLEGLSEPLQVGKSFPLTLTFEKAGEKQIEVAVEKAGATGPGGHAGMDMPMPGHR
jgi:copper(I)-binding protein